MALTEKSLENTALRQAFLYKKRSREKTCNKVVSWYIYFCWLQVVTIDRERLISEKQNNKASPTGAICIFAV